MPIAQTESRQRVKFAREHDVAACADDSVPIIKPKSSICVFIFSLIMIDYIKKQYDVQREKHFTFTH